MPDFTPKQFKALLHLSHLRLGVELFRNLTGTYPRTLHDLVEKPGDAKIWPEVGFLIGGKVPKDPWGGEYQYERGQNQRFRLWSSGADGKKGGTGRDSDLSYGDLLMHSMHKKRVRKTKMTIQFVGSACEQFKLNHRRYPKKLEDLISRPAYVKGEDWPPGGYLGSFNRDRRDGWGNMLIYRRPEKFGEAFDLISLGADGKEGGKGFDADISYQN